MPHSRDIKIRQCFYIALFVVTLMRYVVAFHLPLSPDEAYYRIWAFTPSWGYYDHPPMVAWCIALGIFVVGDGVIAVRLLAPLCFLTATIFLYDAVIRYLTMRDRDVYEAHRKAFVVAALFNATLGVNIFSVVMTPDVPLLLCSSCLLWALVSLIVTQKGFYWLIIAVALAGGFLSKYVMALTGLGVVGWVILTREGRIWLRSWWLWSAFFLALVTVFPCLWWNIQHDWVSLHKQGARLGGWHLGIFLHYFPEWVLGQCLLAFPPIFVAFLFGGYKLCRRRDSVCCMILWCCGVPLLIFLLQTMTSRVQANWTLFLYPFGAFTLFFVGEYFWRISVATGMLSAFIVYGQALKSFVPLNAHWDVALRQMGGWHDFSRHLRLRLGGQAWVVADEYSLASQLAFYPPTLHIGALSGRWRYFDLPRLPCPQELYLIRGHKRRDMPLHGGKVVLTLDRAYKGKIADRYQIIKMKLSCVREKDAIVQDSAILPINLGQLR